MQEEVDLVVVSRNHGPLPSRVERGLSRQQGARVHVHRIVGHAEPLDACRWETIARARNRGKQQGSTPWLMFLDDDVVLTPGCVKSLLFELKARPAYGALAADYLGEAKHTPLTHHVAMGATLFRREALNRIEFRWDSKRCECQCCCDDLRRQGIGIAYSRAARATHCRVDRGNLDRKHDHAHPCGASASQESPSAAGIILTAFNRQHYRRFRDQFLTSLRAAGNDEQVVIVGYGLYPSQQRALVRVRNVTLMSHPSQHGASPALRRLRDFQSVVSPLGDMIPVAYWDAGDVVFQGRLSSLWAEVRAHPNELLVTREVVGFPKNPSVNEWVFSIGDPAARRDAYRLLSSKPSLNGGFAAATAKTMLSYLRAAEHLRNSKALAGTTDWGDQTAMNIYCHSNPDAWREIDESWNYCLYGRDRKRIRAGPDGRIVSDDTDIHVVHGNALTLEKTLGYHHVGRVLATKRRTMLL